MAGVVPLILIPNQRWADTTTAEELGVAGLLAKPVDLEVLLSSVARLLGAG